jgi:hypothetical protein
MVYLLPHKIITSPKFDFRKPGPSRNSLSSPRVCDMSGTTADRSLFHFGRQSCLLALFSSFACLAIFSTNSPTSFRNLSETFPKPLAQLLNYPMGK